MLSKLGGRVKRTLPYTPGRRRGKNLNRQRSQKEKKSELEHLKKQKKRKKLSHKDSPEVSCQGILGSKEPRKNGKKKTLTTVVQKKATSIKKRGRD